MFGGPMVIRTTKNLDYKEALLLVRKGPVHGASA